MHTSPCALPQRQSRRQGPSTSSLWNSWKNAERLWSRHECYPIPARTRWRRTRSSRGKRARRKRRQAAEARKCRDGWWRCGRLMRAKIVWWEMRISMPCGPSARVCDHVVCCGGGWWRGDGGWRDRLKGAVPEKMVAWLASGIYIVFKRQNAF